MMKQLSRAGVFRAGACALLTASPWSLSMAQVAGDTTNTASSAPMQEIVVTATKRSESVEKIPEAISVIGGNDLKTEGINSVSDLQNVAPGVNIGRDVFGVNINIRGVTTTDTTSKGEQGIAYNVDGIFIGRPREQGLALFDIDRIEVLRGPQGTLYGKSSTGGAINIITNKPTLDVESVSGRIEFGNYDTKRGELAVNLPIGDTLAFRASGNFNQRAGYLNPIDGTEANGFYTTARGQPSKNDEDDRTGRFALLWQPITDFTARVTATLGHVGGVGPGTAVYDNLNAYNDRGSGASGVLPNPFPAGLNDNFTNFDGDLEYKVGPVQLSYVAAHQSYHADDNITSDNNPAANYGGPPAFFQPEYAWEDYRGRFTTDSHEFRISNTEPGLFDYVAGANYFRERISESDHNWDSPVTDPTLAGSLNGIDPVNTTTHTSYGVFGQTTWHATEQLGVVAGVRYSSDKVVRVGTFAAGPGPWPDPTGAVCVAPSDCIGPDASGMEKASKVTYRGGLNYQLTPDDLVYASVASGYKAGGFNDFDPVTHKTAPYGPESLVAYEGGFKGRWLNSIQYNTSVFYYDYSKNQISGLVNIDGNMVIYTKLVPTEIYGWENELTWNIDRNTSLAASAAFEKSKYKSFEAGVLENVDWSGYSLDKTPRAVGTLTFNHTFDLANGSTLRFRAFSKISSSYVLSDFQDAIQFKQASYTRSDSSLTYSPKRDIYSIQLFVENIENKYQKIGLPGTYSATIPNSTAFAVTTPRFYGVRLEFKL
jgi:iron complex outermembrane receptor protein